MKPSIGYKSALVVVIVIVSCCRAQKLCTGMTTCFCKYDNGQFLDLSPLGKLDGHARFVNVTDQHEISYSWNPCFNFTEGACNGVALCAIEPKLPHNLFYSIGYQNNAAFVNDISDNTLQLVYTTKGHGVTPVRKSYIKLICEYTEHSQMDFTAIGQKDQLSTEYYFEFRGPLACPQGSPSQTTTVAPSKLSSGDIAGIVIGVLAVVVLVSVAVVVLKRKGKLCKKVDYDSMQ